MYYNSAQIYTLLSTLNTGEMQEVQPRWVKFSLRLLHSKVLRLFPPFSSEQILFPDPSMPPERPFAKSRFCKHFLPLVHANIPQCSIWLWTHWNRLLRLIWHFCLNQTKPEEGSTAHFRVFFNKYTYINSIDTFSVIFLHFFNTIEQRQPQKDINSLTFLCLRWCFLWSWPSQRNLNG